jgi:SAM-dependent methyltransferase
VLARDSFWVAKNNVNPGVEHKIDVQTCLYGKAVSAAGPDLARSASVVLAATSPGEEASLNLNPLAAEGFAGGDRYDRSRPDYPAGAVAALVAGLDVRPGRRVLDLAAGTGMLTRHLAATGAEVVAVEPVEGMRDELRRSLPHVTILAGVAEDLPLPDAAVDVVTVAQAFHWFDGRRALEEIHRVLRPYGSLGLMWNVMDREVGWVDALQEIIHRHRGSGPWYAAGEWRSAFDDQPWFGPLRDATVRNSQVVTPEGVVERVASVSFIATLDPPVRDEVFTAIRDVLGRDPLTAGRETVTIPYRTNVYWAEALGGASAP